ncbi:MAG TPA: hypothetical protein PLE12_00325 [Propionicimonas sp.]|jgi:hypothetical protein|nr:hypothetical protein [Propionicimonas sp.]
MTARATFLRWLATFPAFPLGGLLAVTLVGSITDPVRGALAGLVAGLLIGLAQWLALRPSGIGPGWVVVTTVAVAAGSSLSAALTGAGTTSSDLVVSGLVAGTLVGAGQALVARTSPLAVAAWTGLVAAAWGLAWFVTSNVIVDAGRGYVMFGSSGAVLATILTGMLVRRLVVPPGEGHRTTARPAATTGTEGAR